MVLFYEIQLQICILSVSVFYFFQRINNVVNNVSYDFVYHYYIVLSVGYLSLL